jgi:demethylmenaquinone methyltransferase/2-methoxy-6-polyprenyl-1,4-benzoquinol methylase
MNEPVKPYAHKEGSKKEQVAEMFNNISGRYDLLNRILSLGIDVGWRKQLVKALQPHQPQIILDVATGTADLALSLTALRPKHITGVDISEGMLEVGRQKVAKAQLDRTIELSLGDSEALPFPDQHFDAVTVAFGVRNFENLHKGMAEIFRVLKPGGVVAVLEFSTPEKAPFKQVYQFYFKRILPGVGKVISKDQSAYTYLPDSVQAFPYGQAFEAILGEVGFEQTHCKPLTQGIASLYTAIKPAIQR